jgi:hypothetical protein
MTRAVARLRDHHPREPSQSLTGVHTPRTCQHPLRGFLFRERHACRGGGRFLRHGNALRHLFVAASPAVRLPRRRCWRSCHGSRGRARWASPSRRTDQQVNVVTVSARARPHSRAGRSLCPCRRTSAGVCLRRFPSCTGCPWNRSRYCARRRTGPAGARHRRRP